jgi:hypothetical protein
VFGLVGVLEMDGDFEFRWSFFLISKFFEVELDEDSCKDSDVPRPNVGGVLDPNEGGVLSPMADGVEAEFGLFDVLEVMLEEIFEGFGANISKASYLSDFNL